MRAYRNTPENLKMGNVELGGFLGKRAHRFDHLNPVLQSCFLLKSTKQQKHIFLLSSTAL